VFDENKKKSFSSSIPPRLLAGTNQGRQERHVAVTKSLHPFSSTAEHRNPTVT
jgi:hypothetical protein